MPRPRFHKLPPDKQARILTCAATEFGAHGLDGASLNRIIEKAGISKGAVYYYFDDKTDLLATVLEWTIDQLLGLSDVSVDTLTASTFWPTLRQLYQHSTQQARLQPWAIAVHRAFHKIPASVRETGALARVQDSVAAWMAVLLKKGQQLGVVRTDLPDDLLIALVLAVDEAGDRWVLDRWETTPPAELDTVATSLFDTLQRMVETAPTPVARRRRA